MLKSNRLQNRIKLLLCILLIAVTTLYIKPLQVHAESLIKAIVDSIGSSNSAGNKVVPNGISKTRTGYLVYLLDLNGNKVYGDNGEAAVYALKPSECNNWIGGYWKVTPRKAYTNVQVNNWKNMGDTAWWNMLPWDTNDKTVLTKEQDIKDWITTDNGAGTDNAAAFVAELWQDNGITEQFKTNNAVLVIETILNLQFSTSSNSMTKAEATSLAEKEVNRLKNISLESCLDYLDKYELPSYMTSGINSVKSDWKRFQEWCEEGKITKKELASRKIKLKDQLNTILNRRLVEDIRDALLESGEGNGYELHGDPIYGTVNTLAQYKKELGLDKSLLDSYTNKAACFAERIEQGGIGEDVGFTAWTRSTSDNLSNDEVITYGVGMMVVQANSGSASTHTWDKNKV